MRRYSNWLILVFVSLVACSDRDLVGTDEEMSGPSGDNRPNILYIVADDLGFTDIGAFGSEIPTPSLDKLAFSGMRMTNFHTHSSCQASRVRMMASSGVSSALEIHPAIFDGVVYNGGERGNLLSLNWAILPELLQDAGYVNYIAGKWDLGALEGYSPATRGFERSFVNIGASNSHFAERIYEYPFLYQDDGINLANEDLPADFYATRYYTDKIIEFIQSNDGEQPWFAFVPYTTPHWPLGLPDDWLDRHAGNYEGGYDVLRESRIERAEELGVLPPGASLASYVSSAVPWQDLSATQRQRHARAQEIYAGMVEYMDMSIGQIITYLEESGQLENTVIMFSSDHGGSASSAGLIEGEPVRDDQIDNTFLDNSIENFGRPKSFIDHGVGFGEAATAPFKYSKGTISEGGLRAAAFVYYSKAVAPGVSHALMDMVDILPTFLEIAGTEHPGAGNYKGREINDIVGTSFWSHLTGQSDQVHLPTDSLGWFSGGQGALIRDDYKIINQVARGMGMTAQGQVSPWRLYNIVLDPGETEDISSEHPELLSELAGEWEANWR